MDVLMFVILMFVAERAWKLDSYLPKKFKVCDVTEWDTNNYNTHIPQYLKK